MQHTDTQVRQSGDGMVTVDFLGEGGDVVSVKMASSELDGEAAINRARAIMVQLTVFAEDRDTNDDRWERSDALEERTEGRSETSAVVPILSGDAPASVA